jgi:vitamin B12 transporter
MRGWLLIGKTALLMLIGLFSCAAWAEEAKKDRKKIPMMDEVFVTAGRVEEPIKELTTNVTIIDSETIERSPYIELGDVLGEQGIRIRKYPGSLTSVGIRGFRTESMGNDLKGYALVLLNGRRAGTGNVSKILTKNVERIEIIRGPAAVQYGSAAVGGVVNVITKQGKGGPHVLAEANAGSWSHFDGTLGFSGEYDKKLDFSGTYTYEKQGDYETGAGKTYYNTGWDKLNNVSLNGGWTLFPGNRLGVIYTGFAVGGVGAPGYLSQNDRDDYSDKSNQSLDLIYDGRAPRGIYSWKARYFKGEDKDKWVSPVGSNPDGYDFDGPATERNTDNQGAQAQFSADFKPLLVTAGFDWVNYQVKATWNPKKTEYDDLAGFLLATARFLDERFIVNGGLRYDRFETRVTEPAGKTGNETHTTPSLGLAFLPWKWLKLRANYAEGFVYPEADQLAADFPAFGGRRYVGNPDLKPEKSRNIEGGFDVFWKSFYGQLTYFHSDFDDKIVVTSKAGNISTWKNLGGATLDGLEGEVGTDLGASFEWPFEFRPYVRFTYMTNYKDDTTGEKLKYTPDWYAAFGLTGAHAKCGFYANLNFVYSGEQQVEDWESGQYPAPVVTQSGYLTADLNLSQRLFASKQYGGLTVRGGILNLFNQDYVSVKGYPMPGRSFYLGLRYDY